MTAVPPPPAAPAAPPAPPAQDLSTAGDAARERLATAFPDAMPPGGPGVDAAPPAAAGGEAPPTEDAALDIFAEDGLAGLDLSNMPYRDGKKLEREIATARDRFRPFNDAFGSMDDDQRQQLLQAAPTLGPDLATLSAASAKLHPDDRAFFADAMAMMETDPQRAAALLQHGAEQLRAAYSAPGVPPAAPPGQPLGQSGEMPDWAAPPAGETEPAVDPLDAPMTMRQWQEAQRQQDFAREVHDNEQQIIEEARALGYDAASNDPVAKARFGTLINLAGQPEVGGDLTKAHELMEQARQADIDAFVQGKTADAANPTAPVTGAPPAQPRVLETAEDGHQAMTNRLEAALGPDPRRRTDGD